MTSDELLKQLVDSAFDPILEDTSYKDAVTFVAREITLCRSTTPFLVSLFGGAGAGKTTFATALLAELTRQGIESDALSTDDFVIGDRAWRRANVEGKDPKLKYDFEYFNERVEKICSNLNPTIGVPVPTYDDATGVAIAAGEQHYTRRIGPVQVLIIEGDFDELRLPSFKIYFHLTDEERLRNRIQRDSLSRNEKDIRTIKENFDLRQRLQHFPYTLPSARAASLILWATRGEPDYVFSIFRGKVPTSRSEP